jgi:hypothetical protein
MTCQMPADHLSTISRMEYGIRVEFGRCYPIRYWEAPYWEAPPADDRQADRSKRHTVTDGRW